MSGGEFLAACPGGTTYAMVTTRAVNPTTRMSAEQPPERFCRPDDALSRTPYGWRWQATGVKSSLLTPVARMFVIAALLIALDSAAGVGVLVLLRRGIDDSGVAAGICRLLSICALLALSGNGDIGCAAYALLAIFAARAAEPLQHTVRLRETQATARLSLHGF